jgi:hypothetical protein
VEGGEGVLVGLVGAHERLVCLAAHVAVAGAEQNRVPGLGQRDLLAGVIPHQAVLEVSVVEGAEGVGGGAGDVPALRQQLFDLD